MTRSLGCDIGSAFGYTSFLPNADSKLVFDLVPVTYAEGIPTVAYVSPPDGKEIVVFKDGNPASKIYGNRGYKQLVHSIKRVLDKGPIEIEGVNRLVDPTEMFTAITRDMVIEANHKLVMMREKPIYDVVFTFPASFADQAGLLDRMQKSIEAVVIDGHHLHVSGRLPEPAAAAIDYLHYMQKEAPESARIQRDSYTVLVYDLGHGTFDTAVVTAQSKKGESPYILHQKDGLSDVGGQNFDELLVEEILGVLKKNYKYTPKNDRVVNAIRKAAVDIKHELSNPLTGTASVQEILTENDEYLSVEITRERFEELSQHLLVKTMELVYHCLEDAKKAGIVVDQIVCTGGASVMPMVKNALSQLVENKIGITIYKPSQAVSYGAARFALGIEEPKPITPKPVPTKVSPTPTKVTPTPVIPKKVNPTPKPIMNTVLKQRTDCNYGIRLSGDGLEDEVVYLIQNGLERPASSKPMKLNFTESHVRVWIYRSSQKNQIVLKGIPEKDAISVQQLWFDLKPGKYAIRMKAREDYEIDVELTGEDGTVYQKSTSDKIA